MHIVFLLSSWQCCPLVSCPTQIWGIAANIEATPCAYQCLHVCFLLNGHYRCSSTVRSCLPSKSYETSAVTYWRCLECWCPELCSMENIFVSRLMPYFPLDKDCDLFLALQLVRRSVVINSSSQIFLLYIYIARGLHQVRKESQQLPFTKSLTSFPDYRILRSCLARAFQHHHHPL